MIVWPGFKDSADASNAEANADNVAADNEDEPFLSAGDDVSVADDATASSELSDFDFDIELDFNEGIDT